MLKHLAEQNPSIEQQRLQEKQALERQMHDFESQWLKREEAVRAEYASLETRLRRSYEKREHTIRSDHQEKQRAVEAEWAERVHALQGEFAIVLSDERKKAALEMAALRQEMERQRALLNEEAATKEQTIREQHAVAERTMMESAQQARADLLRQFQAEFEQQNKKHAEALLDYGNTVSKNQGHEGAIYEAEKTKLECALEKKEARIRILQAELEQRAAELQRTVVERSHWESEHAEKISELEHQWAEKEKALTVKLHLEMDRQHAAFAERMLELGKTADYNLQKLREEYLGHERALSARSGELHKREMEVLAAKEHQQQEYRALREEVARVEEQQQQLKKEEAALQQMALKAKAMEQECERARDKLLADFHAGLDITPDSTQTMQSIMEEGIFGFAHQIRNPLAIIRSITETFADPKTAASVDKKSLDWILQAVDSLNRRLEEFIVFSKPVQLSFVRVNMAEMLRKTLVPIQARAAKQSVHVKVTVQPDIPEVSGNEEHFQIILREIFTNALEAMPKNGLLQITMSYDKEQELLTLQIQDSGPGINSARAADIGRPFFTTKAERTGLGLARARRLLHLYAGQFKIESQSGQGTTVTCTFRRKGWAR